MQPKELRNYNAYAWQLRPDSVPAFARANRPATFAKLAKSLAPVQIASAPKGKSRQLMMTTFSWRAVVEQVWNYFIDTSTNIADLQKLSADYLYWLNKVQRRAVGE